MTEDRRKSNPENPGLKVVPKRRSSDRERIDHFYPARRKPPEEQAKRPITKGEVHKDADAVAIVSDNGEAVLLPLAGSNMPQKIIALGALGAIFYFGKPVLVPIVC